MEILHINGTHKLFAVRDPPRPTWRFRLRAKVPSLSGSTYPVPPGTLSATCKKYKSAQGGECDRQEPHAEVVNLENLRPCKGQDRDAQQLCNGNPGEDGPADVDKGGLGMGIAPPKRIDVALEYGARRAHKCAGNVCAEFDRYADADDQIHQRHGVAGYTKHRHGAHYITDAHDDGARDYCRVCGFGTLRRNARCCELKRTNP